MMADLSSGRPVYRNQGLALHRLRQLLQGHQIELGVSTSAAEAILAELLTLLFAESTDLL